MTAITLSASSAPRAFGRRIGGRGEDQLELVRRYLAAIESGATGDDLAAFFTPDVQQTEYPNRLVSTGAQRDLTAILEGAVRGQKVLRAQRYEVSAAYVDADTVVLEVLWIGTLAVPVGSLAPGADMRAHFAMFVEIRDGRIARQRNYDCFDPF